MYMYMGVIFVAHLCLQARVLCMHTVTTFQVGIIRTNGNDAVPTLTCTSYSVSALKSAYNVDICNM